MWKCGELNLKVGNGEKLKWTDFVHLFLEVLKFGETTLRANDRFLGACISLDDFLLFRTKIFIRFPRTLFATEDAFEFRKNRLGM